MSFPALAEDLTLKSVSSAQPWSVNQTQVLQVEVDLPKGFHAYSDQFRINNVEPADFKAGNITVRNETDFFDKFTKKSRKGFFEHGTLDVTVDAPINAKSVQKIKFDLRYQICSESVCFLPKTISIETGTRPVSPAEKGFSLIDSFESLVQSNLWLAFISIFFAGILTSFTPCIFPMLPITISILGYHADKNSRMTNFSRSLAYVLGIALTYSSLGVAAALTGSLFGSALTNKYVVLALVFLFFAMAFSMWGAWEIQSPAFIRNRLGTGHSKGFGGAFLMGLVAGIVASPCVGPVLVSILTYVSTTKNALLGFGLLFTFAMGLGMIFIAIGLFSSTLKLLPKSGAWMERIKFVLGAGMWIAALYYCQFLLSQQWWTALIAASFVALAVWQGAFKFSDKRFIRRGFFLAMFAAASCVFVLAIIKPELLLKKYMSGPTALEKSSTELTWLVYSDEVLAQAKAEKKPLLIDFHAEWCAACHELDNQTFSNPEFKELSRDFKLVKFDATEDSPAIQAVLKKYGIKGLPTVIFINRNGDVRTDLTFTQFLDMNELKPKMQEAQK